MTKNIAIFASGSGSNFQALLRAIEKQRLQANPVLLVCDSPHALVIDRAKAAGVDCFVFSPKAYSSKAMFEKDILLQLQEKHVDWIVLAGYMRLIGETLLTPFAGRILNIHPSLLPSFPGKDAIGQALQAGVNISGVTIHYVDHGMDTGPIIAQQAVVVRSDDTKASLARRIQKVEHALYPRIIQELFHETTALSV
ncbi:phosphoribosylglycinamide formyltransferase [Fictibacillus macauensis ZFHKF-1]|uniref:Phosphoribosylglycinamide formyltransferase n=1 Tax=Fictibacillus macauensis ZFHKF-1 TaxID=1196324 RepID=I8IZG6_9BACL|nr:phosphoribosylglycinamide formyltransferase [Fictibacillus macauensis]EIT84891.1 phosphoribosylglycinamide formyltransferase [Fictibacillus macauensis ZFHKF-1]